MKPIFYEIRRTLTSKFVILMIIAIVGLSSLLAYDSAAGFGSGSGAASAPSVMGGYYISDGNLSIVTYAYNEHGDPYRGLGINMSYMNDQESLSSSSQGFANFTFPYNVNFTTASFSYSYSIYGLREHSSPGEIGISPIQSYSGYVIGSYPAYRMITSPSNSSNLGFLVMYVGNNGSTAPQTSIYLAPNPNATSFMTNSQVFQNRTVSYDNISGFTVKSFIPSLSVSQYNESFSLALQLNGKYLQLSKAGSLSLGRLSLYTPMTQDTLQGLLLGGIGSILGLLIPILGVFAGYLTYGKDKTTGVLESVLKRPVTRGGLITSRYLANSVSIIGSIVLSMVIGELVINHYFHMYPTAYFTLFYIWTYVVEGLSFLGLVYMFSRLVKSQGALLGITITLFIVMGLFWSVISAVTQLALGIGASSPSYLPLTIAFDFASPSGYSTLVSFYFTNKIGTLTSISANPAAYGVGEFALVLTGILWMAVPFAVAFYLARRTD